MKNVSFFTGTKYTPKLLDEEPILPDDNITSVNPDKSNVFRIHRNAVRFNICMNVADAAQDPTLDVNMIYILLDRELNFYRVTLVTGEDKPLEGDIYLRDDFFLRRMKIRSDMIGNFTPEELKKDILKTIYDSFNYKVEVIDVPAGANRFVSNIYELSANAVVTYNNIRLIPDVDYSLDVNTKTFYLNFEPSEKPAIALVEERTFAPTLVEDADLLGGLPATHYATRTSINNILEGSIPVGDSSKFGGKTPEQFTGELILKTMTKLGLLRHHIQETVAVTPSTVRYKLKNMFKNPIVFINGTIVQDDAFTIYSESSEIEIQHDVLIALSPFDGYMILVEDIYELEKDGEYQS